MSNIGQVIYETAKDLHRVGGLSAPAMHKIEAFRQAQFERKLQELLDEAKGNGKKSLRVVSRDLHRQVVGGSQPNRTPMACGAMWKLWRQQGGMENNIIHTTRSKQSSTIEIEFLL